MLEQFKKDEHGLYIFADNYKEIVKHFETYDKIKEQIDRKKRSRRKADKI